MDREQSRATLANIKLICLSDLVETPINHRGDVAINHCCCFRGEMRFLFPKVSFSAVELFINCVAFLKLLSKEFRKRWAAAPFWPSPSIYLNVRQHLGLWCVYSAAKKYRLKKLLPPYLFHAVSAKRSEEALSAQSVFYCCSLECVKPLLLMAMPSK